MRVARGHKKHSLWWNRRYNTIPPTANKKDVVITATPFFCLPTQPLPTNKTLHSSRSKGKRKHPKYNALYCRPFAGAYNSINHLYISFGIISRLWTTRNKDTIQKPYNNKYHHTTITTRNHALLLQYGRAAQYITIWTTTKGNSTNEKSSFYKCPIFHFWDIFLDV